MSRSLAQLSVATAQGQTQLVVQLLKVGKFPLYISQLLFQSAAHRGTRLQAVSSQAQETVNFAEFESQTLHAADKSQRFDIVFPILAEASRRPRGPRQQGIALVEANRVNAKTDLFRDHANLHQLGSFFRGYTLEYSPESSHSFSAWRECRSRPCFDHGGLL
jgi:hypothetical protein